MRDRRRPNHAVHPAMRSRISEASVTQSPYDRHVSYTRTGKKERSTEPGAAMERTCTPLRRCTLLCTMVYRAISMARAMRVRRAAMAERTDDNTASVTCEERENRNAIKVTPVARSEAGQCLEVVWTVNREGHANWMHSKSANGSGPNSNIVRGRDKLHRVPLSCRERHERGLILINS